MAQVRAWITGWLSGVLMAVAGIAAAESRPVVVELFTSQGCSSCPPADAFLHELSQRDDVIALALHVDYWDYIGWKDIFAQPAFTKRQKAYAKAGGRRSVYTPQMIIGGQDHVVGTHEENASALIQQHAAAERGEGQHGHGHGARRSAGRGERTVGGLSRPLHTAQGS